MGFCQASSIFPNCSSAAKARWASSARTLRLSLKPQGTLTALIHFRRLKEVGEAVPHLLSLRPSALEVMDANTLNLIGRSAHGIPADAAATLLAELDSSEGEADLRERADRMAAICRRYQPMRRPHHRLRQEAAGPAVEKPGKRSIRHCIGSIRARSRSTSSMTWWSAPNASAN